MFVFSKVFVLRDHPPTESSLIACALLAAGDVTPPPPSPPFSQVLSTPLTSHLNSRKSDSEFYLFNFTRLLRHIRQQWLPLHTLSPYGNYYDQNITKTTISPGGEIRVLMFDYKAPCVPGCWSEHPKQMPASRESTRAELSTNAPSSALETVQLLTLTRMVRMRRMITITIIVITHNPFV